MDRTFLLALTGLLAAVTSSVAEPGLEPEPPAARVWHGTLYGARLLDENLGDAYKIPARAIEGTLGTQDQYLVGVALSRTLVQDLPLPLFGGWRIEVEGQLVGQFGLLTYPEITGAVVLRTPDLSLPAGLSTNLAVGEGFSYALRNPDLGPASEGRTTQKLLNYLSFEMEVKSASMPAVSLVPRVHHRSGVFGLVGPEGSGTNYYGLGLRVEF